MAARKRCLPAKAYLRFVGASRIVFDKSMRTLLLFYVSHSFTFEEHNHRKLIVIIRATEGLNSSVRNFLYLLTAWLTKL